MSPNCTSATYQATCPGVPWNDEKKVTDYYRLVNREMLNQAGERTFLAAIDSTCSWARKYTIWGRF